MEALIGCKGTTSGTLVECSIGWLVMPVNANFSQSSDVGFVVCKGAEHLGGLVSRGFLGIGVMDVEVATISSKSWVVFLSFDLWIVAIKVVFVCGGDAASQGSL